VRVGAAGSGRGSLVRPGRLAQSARPTGTTAWSRSATGRSRGPVHEYGTPSGWPRAAPADRCRYHTPGCRGEAGGPAYRREARGSAPVGCADGWTARPGPSGGARRRWIPMGRTLTKSLAAGQARTHRSDPAFNRWLRGPHGPSRNRTPPQEATVPARLRSDFWMRIRRARLVRIAGVYAGGAFGVLQTVDILTARLGLPDWFFNAALILTVIGLPLVVATALVQAGEDGAVEGGGPGDVAYRETPDTAGATAGAGS